MDLSKCFHDNKAFLKNHFFLKNCLNVNTLCDTFALTVTAFLCHSHHARLTCREDGSRNNVSPKGCKARAVETWGLGWWEKCGLAVLRRKQCCWLSAVFSSLSWLWAVFPPSPSGEGVPPPTSPSRASALSLHAGVFVYMSKTRSGKTGLHCLTSASSLFRMTLGKFAKWEKDGGINWLHPKETLSTPNGISPACSS